MNRNFYFLAAFLLFVLYSQPAYSQKIKARLTDESVIKDTSGKVYPPSVWKLLVSTGRFATHPNSPGQRDSEFTLIKIISDSAFEFRNTVARKAIENFNRGNISGNNYELKDLRGKVVVLNFWFVDCKPCQMEMSDLNNIVYDFKDSSDVVFLAVALDGRDRIREFLKESQFSYYTIEDGRRIAEQFGVNAYPTNLVIDKEGKTSFFEIGYNPANAGKIRKSIAASLK